MNYIDVGEEGKIFFDKFNKLEDFNKKNTDLIDNEELNRGILIKLPYNKPEDIEAETHPILKDLGKLSVLNSSSTYKLLSAIYRFFQTRDNDKSTFSI